MSAAKQTGARPKAKAATKDVIGDVPGAARINPKWRKQFNRLLQLRSHLLQLQGGLNKEALEEPPTFSQHMADAGTDAFERDLDLGVLSHQQDAIYEIEEALGRIRNGTYGICEMTGRKISPQRLRAIPWTRFTAAAEQALEEQGGLKRPRLGRATQREHRE
jgi:RNA polymerase-binding transcription factor DksA